MDTPEPTTPPHENTVHRNASWGAIISILVILGMIIIGAFYTWGKRVSEERGFTPTTATSTTY